jgi:hypothetical protein
MILVLRHPSNLVHVAAKVVALATIALAGGLLCHDGAYAQIGAAPSPLSTSPLAIGPNAVVGPVGIPLAAPELVVPGLSPAPLPGAGCTMTDAVAPALSAPFDGGGMAGSISTPCAASTSMPGSDTGLLPRTARSVGIPLGSTEMANPGLSPLPPPTSSILPPLLPPIAAAMPPMTVPAPVAPCPVTGVFVDQATRRSAAMAGSSATAAAAGC